MLLRIAFAIFLWLAGLRPVSREGRIRPVGDMYSDMTEKFYCITLVISYGKAIIERQSRGFAEVEGQ